jgi:hypothetical protein
MSHQPNRKRAALKLAFIVAIIIALVAALWAFIDKNALYELKHGLSPGPIIALVVIINLVSFLCFIVMFAAYHWVRRDLRPPREDDIS